jgi:hypothetical protein
MKRIRINGLVKLMNHCRTQLANGIPAAEIQSFRQMVTDATAFVESLCQQHRVSVNDLPGPTRKAYEYLKRIDLDHLPLRAEQDAKPVSSLRISNILSTCKMIQCQFAELARAQVAGQIKDENLEKKLSALHQQIAELAAMVDEICQKVGAAPDLLPDPTRRAYQWLKFLSDQGNFQAHFQTLTVAYRRLPEGHIELYNFAGLYRSRMRKGVWNVVIGEGFVGAPQAVIEALMAAAVSKRGGAYKARIRRYAETDEFRETVLTIEMMGIQSGRKARGAAYNLDDVFKRVNDHYFHGRMEKPILTWNRIVTYAKFGHYLPATDTVMISIALDAPYVPTYVLDQVMYHELLHKKLGARVVNGRRIAHTAKFRAEEKKFKHYQQAQAFLDKISKESRKQ